MSKNKPFGKVLEKNRDALVKDATIYGETHHIDFKPEAIFTKEQVGTIKEAVDLINGGSLAVLAATDEINHQQFGETKHEHWTGRLEVCDGVTINVDSRGREVIGEDTLYGTSQVFVDYPHTQDMVDWYSNYAGVNAERFQKLFD
jgi:hypothetical protein